MAKDKSKDKSSEEDLRRRETAKQLYEKYYGKKAEKDEKEQDGPVTSNPPSQPQKEVIYYDNSSRFAHIYRRK